ncbi:catalase [Sporosarcina sp. GW1-11]|uniref:catalase n=1 Tax=Sporosarcina sp. GW1-11 TaxID=2899126 RepID=UPI00294DB861|nr:catalase [Sporosarcina sp. GW1-11]MDV6378307.1 catalase [Sporosarcina sp. GW1-11]
MIGKGVIRINNYDELCASEAIDAIESVAQVEGNLRRAHAMGVAFNATFRPTGAVIPWTTAAHLQKQDVPAIVRFSHSSPSVDASKRLNPVKGMAVRFELPEGNYTNLVMANVPIFISKTPEAFIRLLRSFDKEASTWSERIDALLHDANYKAFATLLKKLEPLRNFESLHYYAIHAYILVNKDQHKQAVRFEWLPLPLNDSKVEGSSMENELINKVEQQKVQFRLLAQLAEPGDPIDDPTKVWPNDRKKIEAGILTLTSLRSDNAESIVFDPTVTTYGLECSDDPVLHFRSAAYAESARRRGVIE